ncbi:MAG: sodium-dependent transporter [Alphaproteobacteria bacterium]|nr:sodium-dependent transporter [Alphaproteobacteria bacterium]
MSENSRGSWNSKLGMVIASAASAIGLGNLWRFPYLTAKDGGGAFLLAYLFITIVVGTVMVITEVALGFKTRKNPVGAFGWIHPKCKFVGVLNVIACMTILPFYNVVGGWILAYLVKIHTFNQVSDYKVEFTNLITADYEPLVYFGIFMVFSAIIVFRGIQKGIERFCKILLPLLLFLLILMMCRSLTLNKALDGVKFFFIPDFSKFDVRLCLDAMGQVFFSTSVGSGVYITYSSYLKTTEEKGIGKIILPVVIADTVVSLLTGLTIFPAVFAFGVEMTSGTGLVFITFPQIFETMYLGTIFCYVFFLIFFLAAITSAISLMEVPISFLIDNLKLSRKKAVVVYSIYCLIFGTICSLSFGRLGGFTIGGKIFFDQLDFLSSNILLPLGGFLGSIFVGWILGPEKLHVFVNQKQQKMYEFCVKWVIPMATLILFIDCIK